MLDEDSKRLHLQLISLSRQTGGFLTNENRSIIWPTLLNINEEDINISYLKYLNDHRDAEQVNFDVQRSLWHFDDCSKWTKEQVDLKRISLTNIVMSILCKNDSLYYYQGFHDFVCVFMLVINDDKLAFHLAENATLLYITDFMRSTFDIVTDLMKIIFCILEMADHTLYAFLKRSSIEPFFATSWLLTWFSHDVPSLNDVARIFDALLCSPPIYILYLSVAVSFFLSHNIILL